MNYLKHNQQFLTFRENYNPNAKVEKYAVVKESKLFYWISSKTMEQQIEQKGTLAALNEKPIRISKATGRELHPNNESRTVPVLHAYSRYRNEDGSVLEKSEPYQGA